MCLFDTCFCGNEDCSHNTTACKKSYAWAKDYLEKRNLQDIRIALRRGYPCKKYDGKMYKDLKKW